MELNHIRNRRIAAGNFVSFGHGIPATGLGLGCSRLTSLCYCGNRSMENGKKIDSPIDKEVDTIDGRGIRE